MKVLTDFNNYFWNRNCNSFRRQRLNNSTVDEKKYGIQRKEQIFWISVKGYRLLNLSDQLSFQFGRIMPEVEFSLLLVLFILFSLACTAQCILFSTLFSRASTATASSAIIFFLLFFHYQIGRRSKSHIFALLTVALLFCVFFAVCFLF